MLKEIIIVRQQMCKMEKVKLILRFWYISFCCTSDLISTNHLATSFWVTSDGKLFWQRFGKSWNICCNLIVHKLSPKVDHPTLLIPIKSNVSSQASQGFYYLSFYFRTNLLCELWVLLLIYHSCLTLVRSIEMFDVFDCQGFWICIRLKSLT